RSRSHTRVRTFIRPSGPPSPEGRRKRNQALSGACRTPGIRVDPSHVSCIGTPRTTRRLAMKMRPLGHTGIDIAPLVLGGNVFGWTLDESASFEVLDAFVDQGFN